MATVETETEALHFFRASQALAFSLLGTAMVVLSVPELTTNYLWTTFMAIASIFVIVPSTLAVRRARRNRPQEPSIKFRALRRRWWLVQLVFAIAVVFIMRSPYFLALHTGHIILALGAVYVVAAAIVLRFWMFIIVAAAVLGTAFVPFHLWQPAVEFLIAGLLSWLGSFLVFSSLGQ
jgi:hypothetical protein